MRFILNLSLLLAALAFAYIVAAMLLVKLRGIDMPRARGIAILVFGWGVGAVLCCLSWVCSLPVGARHLAISSS